MKKNTLKIILKFSLALGCFFLFYFFALSNTKQGSSFTSSDRIADAKHTLKLIHSIANNQSHEQSVTIDKTGMQAIFEVASFTLKPLQLSGTIYENSLFINANHAPSLFPDNKVLNIHCVISDNFKPGSVECVLGKIPIPEIIVRQSIYSAIRLLVEPPGNEKIIRIIETATVKDGQITISADFSDQSKLKLNQSLSELKKMVHLGTGKHSSSTEDIRHYLMAIQQLTENNPAENRFAFYLQKTFVLADLRAEITGNNKSDEYLHALNALAIAFGNRRFADLFGNFAEEIKKIPKKTLVLAGREDLALHFSYSYIMEQFGTAVIAERIGLLKEIDDMNSGGSGFSFSDLAADKSGIYLVQNLQSINTQGVSDMNTDEFESIFFPAVHDLPDGIRQKAFEEKLVSTESTAYQKFVTTIDERIKSLELFHTRKNDYKTDFYKSTNPKKPTDIVVADFHIHTKFSDGSLTINEIAKKAEAFGCEAIAISDHTDFSNERFIDHDYITAINQLKAEHPTMSILNAVEWNVPPFYGREHIQMLLASHEVTDEKLELFRRNFDDEHKLSGKSFVEAVNWVKNHMPSSLFTYNHPSRKDFSFKENIFDLNYWVENSSGFLSLEGGPGHQKKTGANNGSYTGAYRTVNGWDPAVAVIGGQWDKLLQRGYRLYGAMSNSDYHDQSMDYYPCQYSRTHLLTNGNSEQEIFDAIKQGRFFGSQGNFIESLEFYIDIGHNKRLYSGDHGNLKHGDTFTVSISAALKARNFSDTPTNLIDLEVIVITPRDVRSTKLDATKDGLGYSAIYQDRIRTDFIAVRVRGAMLTENGDKNYFYTNPIWISNKD